MANSQASADEKMRGRSSNRWSWIRVTRLLAIFILAWVLFACSEDPTPPVTSDKTAPAVLLTFPQTADDYDSDNDGLVDISVSWTDSSGVALQSVRLQSGATGGNNLLELWRIERFDSAGLVIEEPHSNLLQGGTQQLVLTVPDLAGNARSITIDLNAEFGSLLKSVGTGATGGRGVRATVCEGKVYVTDGAYLHIANATTLEFESDSFDPWAVSSLYSALCIPGDSLLYVTPHIDLFDRNRATWTRGLVFLLTEIASSRAHPNLLYAGVQGSGRVVAYDRTTRATSFLPIPASAESGDYVDALAVLPNDSKIYVGRYFEGNMLVLEQGSNNVRHLQPRGAGLNGIARDIVVSPNNSTLFIAMESSLGGSVVQWDVSSDTQRGELLLPRGVPVGIAISGDGMRLFVTTFEDNSGASSNYLIDVPTSRIIAEFPRLTQPGELRTDGIPAFGPNGNQIFVPRNGLIDIYLNRR